jgi:hypothetical protein
MYPGRFCSDAFETPYGRVKRNVRLFVKDPQARDKRDGRRLLVIKPNCDKQVNYV